MTQDLSKVEQEKLHLEDRLKEYRKLLKSPEAGELSVNEHYRIKQQVKAMEQYHKIISLRVDKKCR